MLGKYIHEGLTFNNLSLLKSIQHIMHYNYNILQKNISRISPGFFIVLPSTRHVNQ